MLYNKKPLVQSAVEPPNTNVYWVHILPNSTDVPIIKTFHNGAWTPITGTQDYTLLDTKVDKVEGKELSTNDYTDEDKETVTFIKADRTTSMPIEKYRLDNLKPLRYKNLEADVFLPLSQETKISVVSKNHPEYIIKNAPYIHDLIVNPTDWMIYDMNNTNPDHAVRISKCSYLGTYQEHDSCYKLELIHETSIIEQGDEVGIVSFKARGINHNYLPAFASTGVRSEVTSCAASWFDKSSGKYRALVSSIVTSNPIGARRVTKSFSTTDRMGEWKQDNPNSTVCDFADLIPEGYMGYEQFNGFFNVPNRKGIMATLVGINDDSYTTQSKHGCVKKLGIILFSEDLSYKEMIIPEIDYTLKYELNVRNMGAAINYFEGKYYLALHDGTSVPSWPGSAGDRLVFTSKNIEGPYTLHSQVFSYEEDDWMTQTGSPASLSAANSCFFIFNNELYYLVALSGVGGSGSDGNLEMFTMKYYKDSNEWKFCQKGPVIVSLHGDYGSSDNYPNLNLKWGWDHVGAFTPHYIEGNNLWFGIALKGSGSYEASVGYIDLNKALE